MGCRISKTTCNAHQGVHATWYDFEGANWNAARERNRDGDVEALTEAAATSCPRP